MEQKELRLLEDRCIQEWPPACTATCPVHVDVRGFTAAVARGDWDGAYAVYRKTIPFPGILGRICDHPCQAACRRGEVGEAVAVAALERACVQLAAPKAGKILLIPGKNKRVAVAGGGLSGLTAAYDLAAKGWEVTLFEAQDRLGGRLWQVGGDVLPGAVMDEAQAVLASVRVRTRLGVALGRDVSLPELAGEFDAVYLGLGEGGAAGLELDDRGRVPVDPVTFATDRFGVFAGGRMVAAEPSYVGSVSQGRRAAVSIDRYLQEASLTAVRDREGAYVTRLFTSLEGVAPRPAVVPAGPEYTAAEAAAEAERCLQCQCLECVKACTYLAAHRGYPKRYLREIYNNEAIVKGQHMANGLINSCSLCGLCEVVCPNGLDMGTVCKTARERMVDQGKMPPSTHDFALRDMEFCNGEDFALLKAAPGRQSCSDLFFPGCQLSGANPEYVEKVYAYLRERLSGGVGLSLRCCGAPAEWAGRAELFRQGLIGIRREWEAVGRPRIITACPSCYRVFKEELPGVDVVSLWEIYDRHGLPPEAGQGRPGRVALHDACAARHQGEMLASVRRVLKRLGCEVEEPFYSRETTQCCGFGGLMTFADPSLADEVTRRRAGENATDYAAYCAMCRDRLAARGKRTYHLLDLIYGREPAGRDPGWSLRHENRARLKRKMLQEVWGEKVGAANDSAQVRLTIGEELRDLMEQRLILVEDLQKVVAYAERTGNKLVDPGTGRFLAHYRPVSVTYWVEYAPGEEGFQVFNAYSHRMRIIGEVME